MMKKVIKKNRGVTLVSLAIAVTIILILTGVIIYNLRDNLGMSNLQEMQNDIQNLRDKVNNYYATKGAIPAKLKYTNAQNIEKIKATGVISDNTDTGDFYIIDLKELENLTLNYGEDYKKITDSTTEIEASQYEDIYIINEASQNIFYVAGIQLDGEWFYTDYTNDETDSQKVNLRYVEGVKIPDGFYYVGGTKQEGIVISDNKEDMYAGTSHETAQSLKGNQFVWVPVENYAEFERYAGYAEGELQDISEYTEPFKNGYNTERTEYNAMKKSIETYKGFYVGRYEAGTSSTSKRTSSSGINDSVVVKQGAKVYNYIGWSNNTNMDVDTGGAVQKSKEFATNNGYASVTSTLVYGVQWDAIMQWIDPNYKNENETLDKTNSFVANSDGKGYYSKTEPTITGSNADYSVKNIYDLAGNVAEWTMEACSSDYRTTRGGSYQNNGVNNPASSRYSTYNLNTNNLAQLGFRIALYINCENTDEVNSPELGEGMELVKYDEEQEEWVVDETNSAYNYEEQTGTTENGGTSQWANAKLTKDGVDSYFVWIPRFAYKINYKNPDDISQGGSIDVKFIIGTGVEAFDGTICKYANDSTLNPDTDYIIHPAFTKDANYGGGWATELPGIWIGKYESARSDSEEGNPGTSTTIKVQPNVINWRNLTIGEIYDLSKAYDTNLKSHMLKNSEWGAVAYLTYSQYGRNGTEIAINNSSEGITGISGGNTNATTEDIKYKYNDMEKGVLASSTGNVYGIYDLSGGGWEYTSGYYDSGNFSVSNSKFTTGISDENSTVYEDSGITGDAVQETNGWNNDNTIYLSLAYPFFGRGGDYGSESVAGIFAYSSNLGDSSNTGTFRICLVVE